MLRKLFVLVGVLIAAVVVASAALGDGHARHARPRSSQGVTITRDSAGIPHIVGRNFAALGYGEGYAFAQDNLCTFANDIVTLEGQRSKYFGPNGKAVNYSAGTSSTNLESDLYWRYVKAGGIAKRELTAKPPNGLLPQVRQVYTGFVAGYNRYLRSGRLRDPRCKGKPWVRPITLTDMILRGAQIVTEGSAQQFLSGIVQAQPPAGGAQAAGVAPATTGFGRLKSQFGPRSTRDAGSNGVGLGSRDTRSGTGCVLANPHFPWRGTERFWMAQLDVPGRYDVEGGTLMGFPLIGIGFNRHLAWTHTVSTVAAVHPLPAAPRPRRPDELPARRQADQDGPYDRRREVRRQDRQAHVLHDPLGSGGRRGGGSRRRVHLELVDRVRAVRRGRARRSACGRSVLPDGPSDVGEEPVRRRGQVAGDPHLQHDRGRRPRQRLLRRRRRHAGGKPGQAQHLPAVGAPDAGVSSRPGSSRSTVARGSCAPANVAGTPQKGIFSAATSRTCSGATTWRTRTTRSGSPIRRTR